MNNHNHCCYILFNDVNNKTYNGYTNNSERRLRQHNGEIKGGAKYTTREAIKNKWKYLVIIQCEQFDHNLALCFEWMIKYPTRRRPRPKEYQGAHGRLTSLPLVFSYDKFKDLSYIVKVHPDYYDFLTPFLEPFSENIKIQCMSQI